MSDTPEGRDHESLTDEQVEDVLDEAAELQKAADTRRDQVRRGELKESAEEAGIRPEFVDEAIHRVRDDERQRALRSAARRRLLVLVAAGAVALVLLVLVSSQPRLSTRYALVETTRAQLENVLQRRHDLIPQLVAAARGVIGGDTASLEALAGRLQSGSLAERAAGEAELGMAMADLVGLLAGSRQPGAEAIYARLSDEIAGSENRVAVERMRYNNAVASYNAAARGFPTALVRPLLGFPAEVPPFDTGAPDR